MLFKFAYSRTVPQLQRPEWFGAAKSRLKKNKGYARVEQKQPWLALPVRTVALRAVFLQGAGGGSKEARGRGPWRLGATCVCLWARCRCQRATQSLISYACPGHAQI